MPTIIDSLIVRLGLDSKDLDNKSSGAGRKLKDLEGQSGKTEKEVKKLGSTAKESSSGVETLTRSLAGLLALIGGSMALRHFIEETITSNAELERFSKNIGLNVSEVSAWGNAVEEMGGNAKGLQGTMDMLSKSQTELRLTGQSSLIPYFSALGISLATVGGEAKPVDQILLQLSERFSRMDRTTANNMGRMMGIDQDTLNLLLQGRKEVELTIKRQKEYNAVTKEQAEQAVKLQRAQVQLRQSYEAIGRTLLQAAAPALEKMLSLLQEFGGWLQGNMEFVKDFGMVLGTIAAGLGAIALASSPITLTVAGIIALGAAIALLWQDYQTWKRGGDSLIDWAKWESGIDKAIGGIKKLRDELGSLEEKTDKFLKKSSWYRKFDAWFTNNATAKANQAGAAAPASTVANSGVLSMKVRAKAEADRVSKVTGIPADILYAQWAHETGNFTNRGAKDLNNLAGVNVPGGKGQDYRSFKSLDDFGDYYAKLMRPNGLYPNAAKAKTPEEFAAALKAGGYYADTQSNYTAGIRQYMGGVQGATAGIAAAGSSAGSPSTSSDNSVTNHVGEIKVYTQATDADGITRDMGKAMDFLFTSQANAGLY